MVLRLGTAAAGRFARRFDHRAADVPGPLSDSMRRDDRLDVRARAGWLRQQDRATSRWRESPWSFWFWSPVNEITYEPWRDIAAKISRAVAHPISRSSSSRDFYSSASRSGIANSGFPEGYYRRPFDYYLPRRQSPSRGSRMGSVRGQKRSSPSALAQRGGGWLVSWKSSSDVRAEIPDTFPRPSRSSTTSWSRSIESSLHRIALTLHRQAESTLVLSFSSRGRGRSGGPTRIGRMTRL